MVLRGTQIQRCGQAWCSSLLSRSLLNNIARLNPLRTCRLTSTRLNHSRVSQCFSPEVFQESKTQQHRRCDPITSTAPVPKSWSEIPFGYLLASIHRLGRGLFSKS